MILIEVKQRIGKKKEGESPRVKIRKTTSIKPYKSSYKHCYE